MDSDWTDTGKAESGTVEEIREFIDAGKPVLIYFSSVPVVLDSIDMAQYNRLMEFKKWCKEEGLISTYESIGNLREQLQQHITMKINKLQQDDGEKLVKEEGEVDEESEKRSSLEMLRSEFETFLRRLEAEWVAERDSEPMDIEDGKFILESACEEVLDFRAQIVCDGKTSLIEKLDDSMKQMKALQRYHLTIGGESFREFWKQGSQIVDLLKRIPEEIRSALS